jgi:DNA-directed RNA polymerase specialized sigma24 family protein
LEALVKLLERLDSDGEVAGGKYEDERQKLIRFYERKGVSVPDELADATFDRVAQKLAAGVQIENIGAYCYATAKLILKEHWRKVSNAPFSLESDHELLTASTLDPATTEEKELLSNCFDLCLQQLSPEARSLIIEYYSADRHQRIAARQAMADRSGINREAMSNRMKRLRDKLEKCIEDCRTRGI